MGGCNKLKRKSSRRKQLLISVVSDRSFYVKHCQAMSGNVPSSFGACFCAGCYDGLGRTVSAGKTSTGCPTSTDPMRDLLRFEDESVE